MKTIVKLAILFSAVHAQMDEVTAWDNNNDSWDNGGNDTNDWGNDEMTTFDNDNTKMSNMTNEEFENQAEKERIAALEKMYAEYYKKLEEQ